MSIPSLSTIHQDTEKLAYTACHLLLQLIKKDDSSDIQKKYGILNNRGVTVAL